MATKMPDIRDKSEKGTISIAFVEEALVCMREHGLEVNPLLTQAGISPDLLTFPQARVSSKQYGQLWHSISQVLDDEFFGMDSHKMKSGSFTLLCHAIIYSDNLERALRRALRFLHLIFDDLQGELRIEGEQVQILVHDVMPQTKKSLNKPIKRAFAYGTYLMILHGLACWLIGRRIPLLKADFRCAEPDFSDEWRVLFTQNLHFNQACTGIYFSSEYLQLENIQNEKTMKVFLRSAPANFLVKYKNSTSLSAQIRRYLREIAPAQWPDFANLAQHFNASSATLRRRLEAEGQSYRTIVDDLRRDLAISLLSDTQQSVMEIANTLGFAETSAFHRAFKKWTGGRPSEYRLP